MRDNLLELWIEPGKALVDHAGVTLASVEFVKPASDGSVLVNLDLSRDAITPADQEVMVDRVVIYRGLPDAYDDKPCGVFFAGNLCLERDMVYNHKTWLEKLPLPGDLVVFVNTAAYQMDLSASQAFGSVKDRIAWGMIAGDLDRLVRERRTIVEASSGNTAKALQVLAARHGLAVKAYTNRVKVNDVREMLDLLGADVEELPGLSECPDPTAPNDVFSLIEDLLAVEPGVYHHTSQYTNDKNIDVDYLFGGLGTTGSTRGVATYLNEQNPLLRTIGVVSTRQDFIPGIRSAAELWEVGLFQPDFYHDIIAIDSSSAIDATVELATRYGLLAGPTSGATYAVALDYLRQDTTSDKRVKAVVIVCDRLEPYLSYIRQRQPERFGRTGAASPRDLTPEAVAGTPEVTPAELAATDPGSVLRIDTRGSMAYRIGHVPGSINIRDDQLDDMLAHGLPFPPAMRLVFICPIGEYSKRAAAHVRRAGGDAVSLAGGIVAWRDEGYRLEPGVRATSQTGR
jgi:cysteine synthase/rhodanese-related sulfurtransferase